MMACPKCGIDPIGCDCSVQDSNCFTITGIGSAGSPLQVAPILDPADSNLLSCGPDGLLAELPDELADPPAALMTRNANQSIPNNAQTIVDFNQTAYDTDGMVNLGTDRFVIQTPGVYLATFIFQFGASSAGDRIAQILLNGTDVISQSVDRGGTTVTERGFPLFGQEEFAATDFLQIRVFQDSGGSQTLTANTFSPNFAITLLRGPTV